jgi:hypothetical protein
MWQTIFSKSIKKTIMEKFMLIFHGGNAPKDISPEEMQASMGKWFTWIERLRTEGTYVSGEPLLPGGKMVSGKGGKSVTDGPYTEGKEVVGGYFIINAKDINDAAEISKECPGCELGGYVQVRQVMKM